MKEYSPDFSIDIEKVIASKSRRVAKWLPGFMLSYMKRLIHQQEINEILYANRGVEGCEFVKNVLQNMNVSYCATFVNEHALREEGRYIFVSNHPLGGLDGLVLIALLGSKFKEIKFVVNDFLMHIKPLEKLFVPVNKVRSMGKEYLDPFHEAYSSNTQILYFPAGLCSRRVGDRIADVEWKRSFIKHAIRYDREVVPIYFGGRNSDFFYRLANIRKRLGIKFNIEMCFLPDEMFRQAGTTHQVVVGEPIAIEKGLNGAQAGQMADYIREKAYSLRQYLK